MFAKLLSTVTLVVALTAQVKAGALIAPALGVSGDGTSGDVQTPGDSGCGSIDVTQTLDSATPVQAASDGTFTVTATNFDSGSDGSREIQAATVDPSAKGTAFSDQCTISQNGDAAPNANGSQQIIAKLPDGTQCTGGTAGNLCLVSFKTTAGFGNCVVIQQA
ncbi:hypothetical protein K435DRAFT_606858, partial [Dendrothele bispora CBS 962.96]